MNEYELIELFCEIDDACNYLEKEWHKTLISIKKKQVSSKLSMSEIITIVIYFHFSGQRNFKGYYQKVVQQNLKDFFPNLVSYSRFVELQQTVLIPLYILMEARKGADSGISVIDSTTIPVCHIKREKSNKVFRGIAKKGKSTTGWFFGFKLHFIINDLGEIVSYKITAGNVDDRMPVPELTTYLKGLLVGDRGYISSSLFTSLMDRGLKLVTKIRKKMKNKLMDTFEKVLLNKRGVIESINNVLKNSLHISHTRHRSPTSFLTNMISGLLAYSFLKKKPNLQIRETEQALVTAS